MTTNSLILLLSSPRGAATPPLEGGLELLLTNRIKQKWQREASKTRLSQALVLTPCLHFRVTCSREYQPPCLADTRTALWRGPCGEELSSPANCPINKLQRRPASFSQAFRQFPTPANVITATLWAQNHLANQPSIHQNMNIRLLF